MVNARLLKIYILSQTQYLLEWVNSGLTSGQTLSIERSDSPESGFTEIATVDDTVALYNDTAPPGHQKYLPYYYRIKNADSTYSNIAHLPYKRDKYMLKFIRDTERALQRDIGHESYLFHRLITGIRCPDCWSEDLKQATDADCLTCFGATYEGGYSTGVMMYIHFPPESPDIVQTAHAQYKISTGMAFGTNYPLISPEDIIIRNVDKEVFKVGTPVRRTGRRLHVARQIFPIRAVERNAVEYNLIDRITDTKVEQD